MTNSLVGHVSINSFYVSNQILLANTKHFSHNQYGNTRRGGYENRMIHAACTIARCSIVFDLGPRGDRALWRSRMRLHASGRGVSACHSAMCLRDEKSLHLSRAARSGAERNQRGP